MVENSVVEKYMVENTRVENSGVERVVKKFGVVMSFNQMYCI